jgi:hypothetical protein
MIILPNWGITRKVMQSYIPFVLLAAVYIYLFVSSITPENAAALSNPKLADIARFFADETAGLPIKKCQVSANGQLQVQQFFGTANAPYPKTPHNIHITNEFAFVAYYNDGLRIFDLRKNPPAEIGIYDTYIDNAQTNGFSMWGAWGVHALLPSERILISDRNNGFFLFEFDRSKFLTPSTEQVQLYPNPSSFGEEVYIRLPNDEVSAFSVNILDANGNLVADFHITQQSYATLPMELASGCYFVRVTWTNYLGESQTEILKWIKYD